MFNKQLLPLFLLLASFSLLTFSCEGALGNPSFNDAGKLSLSIDKLSYNTVSNFPTPKEIAFDGIKRRAQKDVTYSVALLDGKKILGKVDNATKLLVSKKYELDVKDQLVVSVVTANGTKDICIDLPKQDQVQATKKSYLIQVTASATEFTFNESANIANCEVSVALDKRIYPYQLKQDTLEINNVIYDPVSIKEIIMTAGEGATYQLTSDSFKTNELFSKTLTAANDIKYRYYFNGDVIIELKDELDTTADAIDEVKAKVFPNQKNDYPFVEIPVQVTVKLPSERLTFYREGNIPPQTLLLKLRKILPDPQATTTYQKEGQTVTLGDSEDLQLDTEYTISLSNIDAAEQLKVAVFDSVDANVTTILNINNEKNLKFIFSHVDNPNYYYPQFKCTLWTEETNKKELVKIMGAPIGGKQECPIFVYATHPNFIGSRFKQLYYRNNKLQTGSFVDLTIRFEGPLQLRKGVKSQMVFNIVKDPTKNQETTFGYFEFDENKTLFDISKLYVQYVEKDVETGKCKLVFTEEGNPDMTLNFMYDAAHSLYFHILFFGTDNGCGCNFELID